MIIPIMNSEKRGIIELTIATFLFSLFGVFTRIIASQIGVFFQLWVRAAMMFVLFFMASYFMHEMKKVKSSDWGLLLLRGLLIIVDFSCFYYSVTHLPMNVTLFLFYASSLIFSYVTGLLILKEKLTHTKTLSAIIAIIGLIIMFYGSLHGVALLPSLAALLSGISFGLTTITSKSLTSSYSSTQVNGIGYLSAFLLVMPVMFISQEVISFHQTLSLWITLIGFSFVGVGAFYLTLNGFKKLEVQKASLIMLAELLFTTLIGLLFYSEIPTVNTMIGGMCILVALTLPNVVKAKYQT